MTYHCEICNDKGYIEYEKDGYKYVKPCECVKVRKALENAEKSGLGELLKVYTFDRFKTEFDWQKKLKSEALKYNNGWFAVFGQSGCGKTHICTAICNEFINKGFDVRYLNWIDDVVKLKQSINDFITYSEIISGYKTADLLFIDDFFKINPSPADIRIAMEIISFRYNKKLKTLIASERSVKDIVEFDEAVAGRIIEMCSFICEFSGKEKNYRLKKYL